MDPIQALIQGQPTDEDSRTAMSSALRKQNLLGQLMQVSGDKVLSPLGGSMSQGAMGQAEALGNARLKAEQLAATERLREAQLAATAENRQYMRGFQQETRDIQKDRDTQDRGWKLQKDLSDVAPVMQALKALDTRFQTHRTKGSGSVPGVGFGQSNWLGQRLSGMIEGEDAREMQMLRQSVVNPVLLQRSGAAVTHPEEVRFLIEFGAGDHNTEADFEKAIGLLKKHYGTLVQNTYGGVADDVKEFYTRQGGQITPNYFDSDAPSVPEGGVTAPSWTNEKQNRLEVLEAKLNGAN